MSILDNINSPTDLKNIPLEELPRLCHEIRKFLCDTISMTGGHLGSSLGVVELTVATMYVFNPKEDYFIWDTGHQSYVYKILTDRKHLMHTIRQEEGISGFPDPSESEYDKFVTGHAATSISLGVGLSKSFQYNNKKSFILSFIGDAAIQSGVAFEGLNQSEYCGGNFITILNDNDMSISKSTGAMHKYLISIRSSKVYQKSKNLASKFGISSTFINRVKNAIKNMMYQNNMFSFLGWNYFGPINGHDIVGLVNVFKKLQTLQNTTKPILLHVVTKKGLGYNKNTTDAGHAISKNKSEYSYSKLAAKVVENLAHKDKQIFAITPAMEIGSCLTKFKEMFSSRFIDVGISESAAVLVSAALAEQKNIPFLFIYSTFLQRGFDELIHDIAISSRPVRFIIDRSGFATEDGSTHCGFFDTSFINSIPNFIIMCPSNHTDTIKMIKAAYLINNKPSVVRIPKMNLPKEVENINFDNIEPFQAFHPEIVQKGKDILIISIGFVLEKIKKASQILKDKNINPTIMDLKFIKPLHEKIILGEFLQHKKIIIVEEAYTGGGASSLLELYHNKCNQKEKIIRVLNLKNIFYSHSSYKTFELKSCIHIDNIIDACND